MTGTANNASPSDVLLVHAWVDGELDPANALAFEQRMAADPALAAERSKVQALRQALQAKLPPEVLPPGLRRRVDAAVGLNRPQTAPSWRALAASVALALIVGSGGTWFALRSMPGDGLTTELVDGHMRSLMASQAVDVASSDRHTVKPWFNGRIPQAPRVLDLTQDGFPLVGGRIDVVGGTPVPTLVYRHRQHIISLFAVPMAGRPDQTRRAIKGYNLVGWNADGVAYWAVSDLGLGDLGKFAELFRLAPADR